MPTLAAVRQKCSISGCARNRRKREWCVAHYNRWYRLGDPLATAPLHDPAVIAERFWRQVDTTGGSHACWPWLGHQNGHGYGRFSVASKQPVAHRYAYEAVVGEVPPGMVLDHICKTRHCVNPSHLEAVTQDENLARGSRGRYRQECQRGHTYTEESTGHDHGRRYCRICANARRRERLAISSEGR